MPLCHWLMRLLFDKVKYINGRGKGVTWHKITKIKNRGRKLGERCGVYIAKININLLANMMP